MRPACADRVRLPEWRGRSPAPSLHSRHLTYWPTGYSFVSSPSVSAGCADPPPALDRCAVASMSASFEPLATAETSSAVIRRCVASSAIDSPARRFCVPADSWSPGHSPGTLRDQLLRECRRPRSSTPQSIAELWSDLHTASATLPFPSVPT